MEETDSEFFNITVLRPGHVDLDLLSEDGGAVEPLGRLDGRVLVVEGDEGVAASKTKVSSSFPPCSHPFPVL